MQLHSRDGLVVRKRTHLRLARLRPWCCASAFFFFCAMVSLIQTKNIYNRTVSAVLTRGDEGLSVTSVFLSTFYIATDLSLNFLSNFLILKYRCKILLKILSLKIEIKVSYFSPRFFIYILFHKMLNCSIKKIVYRERIFVLERNCGISVRGSIISRS